MNDYTPRNPRGTLPCGASDHLLPEPVHYDCAGCKRVVVEKLKARIPPTTKAQPPKQAEFPFMRMEE